MSLEFETVTCIVTVHSAYGERGGGFVGNEDVDIKFSSSYRIVIK